MFTYPSYPRLGAGFLILLSVALSSTVLAQSEQPRTDEAGDASDGRTGSAEAAAKSTRTSAPAPTSETPRQRAEREHAERVERRARRRAERAEKNARAEEARGGEPIVPVVPAPPTEQAEQAEQSEQPAPAAEALLEESAPPSAAEAEEPLPLGSQSTDPTELTRADPVIELPLPNDRPQDEAIEQSSVPGDPWGDVGTGGLLSMRALFQFRYTTTYSERSTNPRASYVIRERYLAQRGDGYAINRLFVRLASNPSPYVSFKAVFDFAEALDGDPEDMVKQAYVTLSPLPEHLELVAGIFKIPVSITELDSSNRWEFANFGELNALMGNLGYISRDLGVMLLASPLNKAKRLRLSVGIFRGEGQDEHDSGIGTLAGRIEVNPNKHLRFGADIAEKLKGFTYRQPFETSSKEELPDPQDPEYPATRHYGKGRAVTVDARFKQKGFMLRGEGVYGDRVDLDTRYGAETFWGGWGIVAYRIDFGTFQLLPAFRAEWMDANREADVGVRRVLSGAVTALFLERVRLLIDATHTEVQANSPLNNQPKPIERDPYVQLDNWQVTAQLQLEL